MIQFRDFDLEPLDAIVQLRRPREAVARLVIQLREQILGVSAQRAQLSDQVRQRRVAHTLQLVADTLLDDHTTNMCRIDASLHQRHCDARLYTCRRRPVAIID